MKLRTPTRSCSREKVPRRRQKRRWDLRSWTERLDEVEGAVLESHSGTMTSVWMEFLRQRPWNEVYSLNNSKCQQTLTNWFSLDCSEYKQFRRMFSRTHSRQRSAASSSVSDIKVQLANTPSHSWRGSNKADKHKDEEQPSLDTPNCKRCNCKPAIAESTRRWTDTFAALFLSSAMHRWLCVIELAWEDYENSYSHSLKHVVSRFDLIGHSHVEELSVVGRNLKRRVNRNLWEHKN